VPTFTGPRCLTARLALPCVLTAVSTRPAPATPAAPALARATGPARRAPRAA
jgi:hypothetical protein